MANQGADLMARPDKDMGNSLSPFVSNGLVVIAPLCHPGFTVCVSKDSQLSALPPLLHLNPNNTIVSKEYSSSCNLNHNTINKIIAPRDTAFS